MREYKKNENFTDTEIKGNSSHAQENRISDSVSDESDGNNGTERVLPLDEEVIKRHRLNLEQIHAIPRFKDYRSGYPSEVLCIVSAVDF